MTSKDDAKYALGMANKELIGASIVGTATNDAEYDDEYCWGLVVEKNGQKLVCWIDADPEGNGPGFMQIEELEDVQ